MKLNCNFQPLWIIFFYVIFINMLPESIILQNKFHNANVVKLILEQRVPLSKVYSKKEKQAKPTGSRTGLLGLPSLDPDPTEKLDQLVKQQFGDMLAKYNIKGLTGAHPTFWPDEINSWYEKKYKKKFPYGSTTYPSYAAYIADVIYRSKGVNHASVGDNENNAMLAILAIKSAKQFNEVQKELQKKTGGQGIGQFVFSMFGTYTADKSGKAQNLYSNLLTRGHADTAKRLQRIVTHLQKIGANPKSIEYVQKAWDNVGNINRNKEAVWNSPQMATVKTAYEYRHEIALVASIITPFILPFGLAISSGIMLADAAMYASEGDYLSAGYSAIFALLPGIGAIANRIPAIARLEARGMAALGRRLALSKNPVLNRLELSIIRDMSKYQNLVKQDLNEYFKRRFQNEMIDAMKRIKYPALRKILYRLGNGTIKASVLGGRLAKFGIKTFAPYELSMAAWDDIYHKTFLQQKQQELETAAEIDKILGKHKKTFYKK